MNAETIYVSNDNGIFKSGYVVGRRTLRSLNTIKELLRDIGRGHCRFPQNFVDDLVRDQNDIIASQH